MKSVQLGTDVAVVDACIGQHGLVVVQRNRVTGLREPEEITVGGHATDGRSVDGLLRWCEVVVQRLEDRDVVQLIGDDLAELVILETDHVRCLATEGSGDVLRDHVIVGLVDDGQVVIGVRRTKVGHDVVEGIPLGALGEQCQTVRSWLVVVVVVLFVVVLFVVPLPSPPPVPGSVTSVPTSGSSSTQPASRSIDVIIRAMSALRIIKPSGYGPVHKLHPTGS